MSYVVVDRNGTIMGTYGTRAGAERRRESLDMEYGGYRYRVRERAEGKKNKLKIKSKEATV